jgi:hypothetical protein
MKSQNWDSDDRVKLTSTGMAAKPQPFCRAPKRHWHLAGPKQAACHPPTARVRMLSVMISQVRAMMMDRRSWNVA